MSKSFVTKDYNAAPHLNEKFNFGFIGNVRDLPKASQPRLVAIDTNVFIDLLCASGAIKKKKNCNCFSSKLRDTLSLIERGEFKVVITPTVLSELCVGNHFSKKEVDFLQKYCVMLTPKDPVSFAKNVLKLSEAYTNYGVMDYDNGGVSNDARIMAECTLAGVSLLTNNYRDFIIYRDEKSEYMHDSYGDIVPKVGYKERNIPEISASSGTEDVARLLKYKGRYRALDIAACNKKLGFGKSASGAAVYPMPMTTMDFIGKTSEKQGLRNTKQFSARLVSKDFSLEPYQTSME